MTGPIPMLLPAYATAAVEEKVSELCGGGSASAWVHEQITFVVGDLFRACANPIEPAAMLRLIHGMDFESVIKGYVASKDESFLLTRYLIEQAKRG